MESARQRGGADQRAEDQLVADLDASPGLERLVVHGERSVVLRRGGAAGEGGEQQEGGEGAAHIEILFNPARWHEL
jgi:hypothetical protein